MTTILLSAGDLSGERHAAELVRVLRTRFPTIRFVGMGGAAMARAGVELAVDQKQLAVGGIFEVAGSLPRVVWAWRAMQRCLRETQPELIILVDSGGFNLPFARWARTQSKARILYYMAPQVWAWRTGRLRKLVNRTDRIAVIVPFERDFYASHGIPVDFVGHPAVDRVAPANGAGGDSERKRLRQSFGIDDEGMLLGIFPGSRRNEIARHLPIQLRAFSRLRAHEPKLANLKCMVVLASSLDRDAARKLVAEQVRDEFAGDPVDQGIHFAEAGDESIFSACDLAVAKPGTITVELMLRRIPMVVIGRVNRATALIARRSLRIKWFSMPNLVANDEIVPELMQDEATPIRIAAALAPLFEGEARERQIEQLDRACAALGEPGTAIRVAAIVEEMLGTHST